MKRLAVFTALLLTGACAVPADLPSGAPAPQGANTQHPSVLSSTAQTDCMKRAAGRIDDGQKDTATVAAAVAASCQSETIKAAQAATQGLTPAAQQAAMAQIQAQGAGVAGRVVVQERRRKANRVD